MPLSYILDLKEAYEHCMLLKIEYELTSLKSKKLNNEKNKLQKNWFISSADFLSISLRSMS